MMIGEIIIPTREDLENLAKHMRGQDAAEMAALGMEPLEGLLYSANTPYESYAWRLDGEVGCAWGLIKTSPLAAWGRPWMLSGTLIDSNKMLFMKASRFVVEEWKSEYDYLENYVDVRYVKAINWLKWLGFTIAPSKPIGINGEPFSRAYWSRYGN